jgi:tryptophan synthase alpha chain
MFNLKKQPSDKLFIPFITAGDPLPEVSIELAKSLQEAGRHALSLVFRTLIRSLTVR